MPRTYPSSAFETHVQQDVTSLALGWKIVKRDGSVVRINTTSRNVTQDFGFPAPFAEGEQTYSGGVMGQRTNLDSSAEMDVDNLTIMAAFDSIVFDDEDLRRGAFNGAEIFIFTFNHQDTSQGALRLFRGLFGDAKVSPRGFFQIELRNIMEIFRRQIGELYTQDCRADLGDSRCRVPISPNEIGRLTAYSLGSYVKVQEPTSVTIINPGGESGTTGWTNEVGTLRSDNSITPHSASNYFAGGTGELETKAYQDLTIDSGLLTAVDAGEAKFNLTWFQQSADEAADDTAGMTVRFYDAGASIIGTETSSTQTASIGEWTGYGLQLAIPATARTIRIAMRMLGNTGPDTDSYIDRIRAGILITNPYHDAYSDRIYKVTTAGTTGLFQPEVFSTTVGAETTDGTAVFTTELSWTKHCEVVAVESSDNRRTFYVSELTPSTGGSVQGRDYFPDESMDEGVVWWETGDNIDTGMEIRTFTGDDGVTIVQKIELFRHMVNPIQIGDTLRVYRGCDKTKDTCMNIFNNAINAVAEWYVPGRDATRDFPDAL